MVCKGFTNCLVDCRNKICSDCGFRCETYKDNRSIVVCKDKKSEAKSEYHLKNENRNDLYIQYFLVDGAVVDDVNTKKCDNLLILDKGDFKTAVLVELKGHKVNDAYPQICYTFTLLEKYLRDFGCNRYYARIVISAGNERGRATAVVSKVNPDYTKLCNKLASINRVHKKDGSKFLKTDKQCFYEGTNGLFSV